MKIAENIWNLLSTIADARVRLAGSTLISSRPVSFRGMISRGARRYIVDFYSRLLFCLLSISLLTSGEEIVDVDLQYRDISSLSASRRV